MLYKLVPVSSLPPTPAFLPKAIYYKVVCRKAQLKQSSTANGGGSGMWPCSQTSSEVLFVIRKFIAICCCKPLSLFAFKCSIHPIFMLFPLSLKDLGF